MIARKNNNLKNITKSGRLIGDFFLIRFTPKKENTMGIQFLKRGLFQRIFGIPATSQPQVPDCWTFADGKLTIDLKKAKVLKKPGGALRFEGGNLPKRVLVVYGEDKKYRAYHNRCTHIGHRRLDPVPGTGTVQCCSVNKSTYDAAGEKIYGPAPRPIATYPAVVKGNQLTITLS
jgi:nitrite reductase/ring-hydroxylating ferredoxin subunit